MKLSLLTFSVGLSAMCLSQKSVHIGTHSDLQKMNSISTSGFILENSFSDFTLLPVEKNGTAFQRIQLRNHFNGSHPGNPELPVFNQLIEIPADAEIKITILDKQTKTIDLDDYGTGKLYPAQASVSKSQDPKKIPFSFNSAKYAQNTFIKDEIASVQLLGKMRGTGIGKLKIAPFQYNPVTNELIVLTDIKVKIDFLNINENLQKTIQQTYGSPLFNGAFSKLANHDVYKQRDNITTYPTKYVIVADPMFENALQPLVEWKTKKGFTVIEAYTNNPQVGNTSASIKNYLQNLYNSATSNDPAPTYVLFVGDDAQIPPFQGTTGQHVTDLYFCEFDGGGDYFPEMYYGRFSANNVNELQPQIDKTIEYEKYLFPDPSFLDNVILIAGVDSGFAPIHGNGQINYGTSTYFNTQHGFDPYVWLYPASEGNVEGDIITQINRGNCFINYTAHGYEQGWADPSLSNSDVNSFTNAHKYATMIGNCCLTNTFNGQTCFGETLMRAANKGAIGYIGGSNTTTWDEDYWFGSGFKNIVVNPTYDATHLGAYDCVFHENGEDPASWYVTQSQLIFSGNMAVTESGSGQTHYYWEVYHLMGDPSLMTYMTQAAAMTVNHVAQDVVGITSLQVNAEPHAYVAVSLNGVLLDAKYTGTGSSVILSFPAVNNVETLDVVVTKQDRQPYFGTVELISPTNTPYIVLNNNEHIDIQGGNGNSEVDYSEAIVMNVALKNIGDITGNNITAVLSTSDSYVTITDNTENWGTINAGDIETINASYAYQVANNVPDQHQVDFVLTITDNDGHSWIHHIYITINAPSIEVLELTINDVTGNNNGKLDVGESATLLITAKNVGHADLTSSNGTISTGSTNLSITTSTDAIGTMIVGDIITGTYNVTASANADCGELASINNIVGTTNYSDNKDFNLIIGLQEDDFESNSMNAYDWTSTSSIPWSVATQTGNNGQYCSKSGTISDNAESNLVITLNVTNDSEISFMKKVSSESGYDYLRFFIDNTEMGSWSGDEDWTTESYNVSSGTHTFKWAYKKDESVQEGSDAAWVDDIVFPAMSCSDNASVQTLSSDVFNVYPNPASNSLFVAFNNNGSNAVISIRDMQGKEVYTTVSGIAITEINTAQFSNGMYTIEVTIGNNKLVKRFVKN